MTPAIQTIGCPVCARALPPDTWNLDYETYCPNCRAPVTAMVFPALLRADGAALAEAAVEGTEATCFFHARKKAVVPCDQCGRFLCSLCQVELSGQNWCPSCIDAYRRQGKLATLDSRRTLYDNMTLLLATVPILMWPLLFFSAPATLFLVFRYWKKPSSIVPRTKVRFLIAGLIAVAEIVGMGVLLYFVVGAVRARIQ